MILAAIAAFFKYKIVGSVIVLACWPQNERTQMLRALSRLGLRATITCDTNIFNNTIPKQLQGALYFGDGDIINVQPQYFAIWYKWLVIANGISAAFDKVRYDSDMTLLRPLKPYTKRNLSSDGAPIREVITAVYNFEDIYIHPSDGASVHPWASWSEMAGFQPEYERERILRRQNMKKYPFRISTPMSRYVEGTYNGTFYEYVADNRKPTLDSNLGCSLAGSQLLVKALNATEVVLPTLLWTDKEDNRSMLYQMVTGQAEISGAGLRPLHDRITHMDFVLPMWTLRLGFTYLAERDSSGNMFVMPFDASVWWCCLATGLALALLQRLTAKTPAEKDGAVTAVLATTLQQDAEYPEGASGRFTFMVLSLWAMMIYAYYSSAIVSALMSAGQKGPETLRALADSKYSIFSDDYDYIRYLLFERKTNQPNLEYLKKKKMTSNFYQTIKQGVEIIRSGTGAYHAEFNNFYPHLKTLTDNQVCKLSYVDTLPAALIWTVATKRSPYTDVLRIAGCKLHERGLGKRVLSQWRMQPAPCRAALLAERVKLSDVAPLLGVSLLGLLASVAFLVLEVCYAKWKGRGDAEAKKSGEKRRNSDESQDSTFYINEFIL